MVTVIGVRFKKAGKIYYFDPDGIDTSDASHVIVETARGIEFGHLVVQKKEIDDSEVVAPLKKALRVATEEDIKVHEDNQEKKKETFDICVQKIRHHKLEMKLIDVEYTFDNNKVIFYFTSDGRVDFRELVKDLASVFRTRIELRQIGVRDEAKMMNGIGTCGKRLCCANWLGDFEPVSIKMAKDQNLSLNPTKISGICGRLMCCLKYEHEVYLELKKGMPHDGETVMTPDGKAVVMNTQTIREQVKVRLIVGDEKTGQSLDEDVSVYKKTEITRLKRKKPVNKDGQKDLAKDGKKDLKKDTRKDTRRDKPREGSKDKKDTKSSPKQGQKQGPRKEGAREPKKDVKKDIKAETKKNQTKEIQKETKKKDANQVHKDVKKPVQDQATTGQE